LNDGIGNSTLTSFSRRGQSLVVWAIHEGRGVAEAVDSYLKEKRRDEIEAGKPTSVFANLSSISPHV
jgi:hypothetical protein